MFSPKNFVSWRDMNPSFYVLLVDATTIAPGLMKLLLHTCIPSLTEILTKFSAENRQRPQEGREDCHRQSGEGLLARLSSAAGLHDSRRVVTRSNPGAEEQGKKPDQRTSYGRGTLNGPEAPKTTVWMLINLQLHMYIQRCSMRARTFVENLQKKYHFATRSVVHKMRS
jgi:hypothetical protein